MHIREGRPEDREFIERLAPRLIEFGQVAGRDPVQMVARDRAALAGALERPARDAAVFVAEDDHAVPVGFIHLTTTGDYYTDSTTAHVADIVVAEEAAGRGVGSALIGFAEEWARVRGFAMLTLSVFIANERARTLYRRLGFDEEWIRCIKRL
jgi:ribosomal protein S18 acetylase RimI-like enzyme